MGTLSVWHILIVAAIILLLFGGQGKISDLMGDVGRGIKAFRIGLSQSENNPAPPRAVVSATPHDTATGLSAPLQLLAASQTRRRSTE